MRKFLITISALTSIMIMLAYLLGSCRKSDNPNGLNFVSQEIPEGFPDPRYRFADNPLSEEGIALGRKLFYDGRLSKDGNYPCASCHNQVAAFGTFEHDRSHGYNNSHTLRNAPVLFNLAWKEEYHWDGRFSSLFEEAAQPIHEQTEMAENFNDVIAKLQADPEYRQMFRKVFHTDFISAENLLKALAQFTGTLISANSKYDRVIRGEDSYSSEEQLGYQIFQTNCSGCHPEPMFTDYSFRNTGLPIDNFLMDYGRFMVTGNPEDSLKFMVPTLRNVNVSSNYMHDGRFITLGQSINHYRSGIIPYRNLDPALANGIQISDTEAAALVRFLRTLTDSTFMYDNRYNQP